MQTVLVELTCQEPAPTQRRVLAVLWKHADPAGEVLPATALKAFTHRKMRGLLLSAIGVPYALAASGEGDGCLFGTQRQ